MELKGKALDFYLGIMVGVVGNLVASCLVEVANSIFEGKSAMILGFWGFMFGASSVGLFQITKLVMKHYAVAKPVLKLLDLASVICIGLAVFVIVFAVLR